MRQSRVSLRAAITKARLTQTQVARELNVSVSLVNRWVRGNRRMTFRDGQRLAKLLGIPPELLDT